MFRIDHFSKTDTIADMYGVEITPKVANLGKSVLGLLGRYGKSWKSSPLGTAAGTATGLGLTSLGVNSARNLLDSSHSAANRAAGTSAIMDMAKDWFVRSESKDRINDAVAKAPGAVVEGIATGVGGAVKDGLKSVGNWALNNKGQAAGVGALAVGVPALAYYLHSRINGEDALAQKLKKERSLLEIAKARYQRQSLQPQYSEEKVASIKSLLKAISSPMKGRTLALTGIGVPAFGAAGYSLVNSLDKGTKSLDTLSKSLASGKAVESITDSISNALTPSNISAAAGSAIDTAMEYPFKHPLKFLGGTAAAIGAPLAAKYLYNKAKNWYTRTTIDDEREKARKSLKTASVGSLLKKVFSRKAVTGVGTAAAAGTGLAQIYDPQFVSKHVLPLATQAASLPSVETIRGMVDGQSRRLVGDINRSTSRVAPSVQGSVSDTLGSIGNWLNKHKWPIAGGVGGLLSVPFIYRAMTADTEEDKSTIEALKDKRKQYETAEV